MKTIDLRALACPGPVLKLRDLLDDGLDEVRLHVGDGLACSNVTRFARSRGAEVESEGHDDGSFTVSIHAGDGSSATGPDESGLLSCEAPAAAGPLVVQISADAMGRGDDDLGRLLLRSFVKTLKDLDRRPATIVFYNSGVHLCCAGSPVLDDLRALEGLGASLLACGTCLNFFDRAEELEVGRVTDMLEIATTLAEAGATIRP